MILEWAAFISAAIATVLYGRSVKQGAAAGIAASILFIAWGYTANLYGAFAINIGFLGLHLLNLRRGYANDSDRP